MRFAAAVALLLALVAPVHAQTSAQAPARPAAPSAEDVAQAYAAMPEAERQAIQADLIWTGDYIGGVDGDFGPRSIAAVRSLQKRNRWPETGILGAKERETLRAAAERRRVAVGWRLVDDAATGARIGVPSKLMPQQTKVAGGSRWASPKGDAQVETFRISAAGTTLKGVFDAQIGTAQRTVTYSLLRPDFFVVSGTQAGRKVYVRAQERNGEVRGFSAAYDTGLASSFDPIAVAMASAFQGFPGAPVALGPLPRRKVEYGTGVFVSAAGHVITSHDLIDGCNQFEIAQHGAADLLAADKERGLALLRLYGTSGVAAMAIADAVASPELTLLGVVDPARQQGGTAVSTASARLVPAEAGERPGVEPAPGLGFGGAAAVGADGRLVGLVDLRLQRVAGPPPGIVGLARLIPGAAVRALLDAQGVAPAAGPAGSPEAARAAVVRVICLRP